MLWFNQFTTGLTPVDAKGHSHRMRMFWILLPGNRSQNNIFFAVGRIINVSFNSLAYNTHKHLAHCYCYSHRGNQDVF